MISIRTSDARGRAELDWLKSRHTFSFADYFDPDYMGFRTLRVLNEDWVAPRRGFGLHPHRDMEIVTWVLSGALRHADDLGNGSVIRPGVAQRMSAGSGIRHSEENPSADETTHLLQIWIQPTARGGAPSYEEREMPLEARTGRLACIASPDGEGDSLTIGTDARIFNAVLAPGDAVARSIAGRHAWVQVASGEVSLSDEVTLDAGDGAALTGERELAITARRPSEVLVFDLP